MKATIFHNKEQTNIITTRISKLDITPEGCRENLQYIHTTSVLEKTTVDNITIHDIHSLEQTLLPHTAQLRVNKSPFLSSYLHTVNPKLTCRNATMLVTHT